MAWVKVGNLKGTTGTKGPTGVGGGKGHPGATGHKGARGPTGHGGAKGATGTWSKTHTDARYKAKSHTHKAEEITPGKFAGSSAGFHSDVYMHGAWGTAGYMFIGSVPAGGGGTRMYWHGAGGVYSHMLVSKGSARKYKENIVDAAPGPIIEAIRGLRMRQFQFNDTVGGYGPDRFLEGVVAEEAVEQFPHLVLYEDGEVEGFAYGELIMPTVVAMQDLIARVEGLEAG